MKEEPSRFDFIYAVRHTRIVVPVAQHLDSFGNTLIKYTLLTEPMDCVGKVRIREGQLQTFPPRLMLLGSVSTQELEGFSEEAQRYMAFLKEHEREMRVLQYSYRLRRESFREFVVSDSLEAVCDRVKGEMAARPDPYGSLVVGVDEPWDVCLLNLFCRVVERSAAENIRELERSQRELLREGVPRAVRAEVEEAFAAATADRSLVKSLGALLKKHGVFEQYQDRFFALIK